MKRFLRHIAIFLTPFIIGVGLLFLKPVDREFAYDFLKNDCYGHGAWIHDRIYENERPVDVAFIGSSGTIQAVYEEEIEKILAKEHGANLSLANFGYCRPGRNLHFVILKDLLSQKEISTLVLDVREDEDRYSHPVFPNLAYSKDVLLPVFWFNRDIFSDWFTALVTRFEFHKRKLFGMYNPASGTDENPYGYGAGTRVAPKEEMDDMMKRRSRPKRELGKPERNFYMRYPRSYLKKIAGLCKENNIDLVFLFLKGYGIPDKEPKELSFYQNLGEVWIPPDSIIVKQGNWMDPDHLNIHGASELAPWLAEKISEIE